MNAMSANGFPEANSRAAVIEAFSQRVACQDAVGNDGILVAGKSNIFRWLNRRREREMAVGE